MSVNESRHRARLLLAPAALIVVGLLAVSCKTGVDEPVAEPGTTEEAQPADPLFVKTRGGMVQGDVSGSSRRFLAIPYAKPPIEARRWKAPEPAEPWSGVRHATEFPKACVQNASNQGAASLTEDCLYLNVWAPKERVEKAPVMLWIHGGGNFAGSTGDNLPTSNPPILWYDGQFFAANHGIVLVSVNYRLGPFGFFSHPDLKAEGSPLGNQGLLDQQAALRWVRDNIAAFGGDPGNVTIFGESAGASDVCHHIVSPASRGLFHRAVAQSGGCTSTEPASATASATAAGQREFASALGCTPPATADTLACLRAKTVEEIMQVAGQPNPSAGALTTGRPWSFNLIVDGPGGAVPDVPRALFGRGDVAKVPLLIGTNTDEGTLFIGNTNPTDDAAYQAAVQQRFPRFADDVLAAYPAPAFASHRQAFSRAVGDATLICGSWETATMAASAGLPVYAYNFNVPWALAPDALGAAHAAEISHVFGNPYKPDEASAKVGEGVHAYWASFARSGDPNHPGAPASWPAFTPDPQGNNKRLQLDTGWSVLDNFKNTECAFWRAHR